VIVCAKLSYQTSPFVFYRAICLTTPTYLLATTMSTKRIEIEKPIEEVMKMFMDNKDMFEGVHASSTRGLQTSPLTGCHSKCVDPATEK
jgi:hypothetical protein